MSLVVTATYADSINRNVTNSSGWHLFIVAEMITICLSLYDFRFPPRNSYR